MKRVKGFTLIELLIVVAIIAILAAIAVPNFLEAQVRSKVSRAKADMRSLSTAIETYMVDNNKYFHDAVMLLGNGAKRQTIARRTNAQQHLFNGLTTPLAYMNSDPSDPFADYTGTPFGYYNFQEKGWILWSFGPDLDQRLTDSDISVYNAQDLSVPVYQKRPVKQGPSAVPTVPPPTTGNWGNALMKVKISDNPLIIESGYDPGRAQPSIPFVEGRADSTVDPLATQGGVTRTDGFTYDTTNGTTSPGDIYRCMGQSN